jgi:hypothetical protein
MSNKKNRYKQRPPAANTPKVDNATQTAAPAQSVEEAKPVTIESLATSTNQAELK